MKTKPFNLEEAKAGKLVVTRDGRPVKIVCFDRAYPEGRCLLSLIKDGAGVEDVYTHTADGRANRYTLKLEGPWLAG